MKRMKPFILTAVLACGLLLAPVALSAPPALRMATTTSTDNTGLLDVLAPEFTRDTGIKLEWVAVGTGAALKLGQNCDVSVLMVHAPAAEKAFVEAGYGLARHEFMYNDFVIAGPASDPAGVKGDDAARALARIRAKGAPFVSRGDNSGTHKKEKELWAMSGEAAPDKQPWYLATGQGMLNSAIVAGQKNAYILIDRGSYIKYEANEKGQPPLVILVEGAPELKNIYSVIAIDPQHCSSAQHELAQNLIAWVTGARAQKLIGDFRLMGKTLFTPSAK